MKTTQTTSGFTKASLMQKKQDTPQDTPQDTLQDTPQDTLQDKMHIKLQIENLLNILDGEMSREEIQKKIGLKDRSNFSQIYLIPALNNNYIEMTIPEKPRSKYQKYRLTKKGKNLKTKLQTTNN